MENPEQPEDRRAVFRRPKGPLQRHPYLVLAGAGVLALLVVYVVLRYFFIPLLLLTSIAALVYYWKRLKTPHRAVAVGAIVVVVLMWWLLSREHPDVIFVRETGRLALYPYAPIGAAFDQYLWASQWRAETDKEEHYVTVTGKASYDGKKVAVKLRFHIKPKDKYVQAESLDLDQTLASAVERSKFLGAVFQSYEQNKKKK
jgi:hypothetical protein